MFRLLLLVWVVTVHQNAAFGKPLYGDIRSVLQVDFSDLADPDNDLEAKRNAYQAARDSQVLKLSNPSSLCYFLQESDTESQISCRLRFTRSKFNFNPFGLRFGKRQEEGVLASGTESVSETSGQILQALLKLRPERRGIQCGGPWAENC